MASKFRIPIALMLGGLVSCVSLLVWFGLAGVPASWPWWVASALFAVAGGLIVLSGAT